MTPLQNLYRGLPDRTARRQALFVLVTDAVDAHRGQGSLTGLRLTPAPDYLQRLLADYRQVEPDDLELAPTAQPWPGPVPGDGAGDVPAWIDFTDRVAAAVAAEPDDRRDGALLGHLAAAIDLGLPAAVAAVIDAAKHVILVDGS